MSILTPGQDKVAARALLTRLVGKYARARAAMKQLPMLPETQKLHRGYYQYFSTAHDLFASYLTVQDNLFAQDENGQPVLAGLVERKQKLETLNNFIQDLDRQTRAQFGVPAYRNPAG
jgi:GH43 family beta-xylosidase